MHHRSRILRLVFILAVFALLALAGNAGNTWAPIGGGGGHHAFLTNLVAMAANLLG